MRVTSLLLTLLAAFFATATLAADIEAIRNNLRTAMPNVEIGEIRPSPIAGLFEVVGNKKNVFYVEESGKLAFMGNIVDLAKKQNLTQQRAEELSKIDFAQLPLDNAIVKVKGNGSRKIALFSDPDCPFCKQLEKELVNITDVTIYTFLYPLTSIHPDARRKAEIIWCASDRAKIWDEWMLTGKELPSAAAKCETPIAAIEALGEKLGVEGTPGIVFANGRLVEGAMPKAQIESLLNAP
jgi:thiol:disulfide interchange protein DsbC